MRLLVMLPFICLLAAAPTSEDLTTAAAVFAEARALSDADAGSLWGAQLYGPMLLVDADSRVVMANLADDAGILRPNGTVFSGVLPDSVGVANTALFWGGRDWTMLMWPLPEDRFARRTLVAHELWHRIQDRIGLPGRDPSSAHLVTYDGRLWLQLEWRALAEALVSGGMVRDDAVRDALAFRAYRRSVCADSREAERQLELHEGLAEYTGFALSGRDDGNAAAVAEHLREAEGRATFVRSFAYASGPAYGLLLDAYAPNWREGLTQDDDLGDLLARHVDGGPHRTLTENTDIAVAKYGGDVLIESERRRADKRLARIADIYFTLGYLYSLEEEKTEERDGETVLNLRSWEFAVNTVLILPKGFFLSLEPSLLVDHDLEVFSVAVGAGRALSRHFAFSVGYAEFAAGDRTFNRAGVVGLQYIR